MHGLAAAWLYPRRLSSSIRCDCVKEKVVRVLLAAVGATTSHATMTEDSLIGAVREVFDPAVVARARKLATQVSWNGAEIAARRLEAEYGGGNHQSPRLEPNVKSR
jgi:hypothetical protein